MQTRHKNLNSQTFNQHLYRLRKKGIIKSRGGQIIFSKENLLTFSLKKNSVMKNIFPKKTEKILISFDIPETKKKTRDWLRNQIKYWDFEMVHKSLWLGYGPFPEEFNSRLNQLNISGNVRVFRLKKP
jgi:DNA-binding transcriptional regulator PaaX